MSIVGANGIELAFDSFGEAADPAILLIAGTMTMRVGAESRVTAAKQLEATLDSLLKLLDATYQRRIEPGRRAVSGAGAARGLIGGVPTQRMVCRALGR